jgi:hypothetical protein
MSGADAGRPLFHDEQAELQLPDEVWSPIAGLPDYEVSTLGRIRSWKGPQPKIIKVQKLPTGYRFYRFGIGKGAVPRYIHRLVLEAFVGPCPDGMQCRHLDGDRANNCLSNLAWGTPEENQRDRIRHGTLTPWQPPGPRTEVVFTDPIIPVAVLYPHEVWADIPDAEGYQASTRGRIRSSIGGPRSREVVDGWTIMKQQTNCKGYKTVRIRSRGKGFTRSVHRLVIESFKGPCPPGLQCLHYDGDRTNNRLDNLRWGTPAENQADRVRHGTSNRGERCAAAKLTNGEAKEIRRLGKAGTKARELAERYGVSVSNAADIIKGRRWVHLDS